MAVCIQGVVAAAAAAQSRAALDPSLSYNLDLYQGPINNNPRILGLSGAFTAVAEGTGGIPINPASVANRVYYSETSLDYDYDWAFLTPGLIQPAGFDYFNSGITTTDTFTAFSIGGHFHAEEFGFGLYFDGSGFDVNDPNDPGRLLTVRTLTTRVVFGRGFFEHQIIAGTALRLGTFRIENQSLFDEPLYDSPAFGVDAGILYRPRRMPWRIGATIATPTLLKEEAKCRESVCDTEGVLPETVVSPWRATLGAAYFIPFDGQRFNPLPRYRAEPDVKDVLPDAYLGSRYRGGRYVMLSADLEVISSVPNAIALPGFVRQEEVRAGERFGMAPRLGIEAEVIERRLRLRAGTYVEPARITGENYRPHGTFGFQVRLFDLRIPIFGWYGLSLSAAIDGAKDYTNFSWSVFTFWH